MGLCVILCAFVLARKGAVFVQSEQAKSAPVCIVVDAGHGGDDPGKIGINDALEKDINLQIALKLQKILEQNNIKVVMTETQMPDCIPRAQPIKKQRICRNAVKLSRIPMPFLR